MKQSKNRSTLLPLYAKINRNALGFCAVAGFALAAPVCWQIACFRLLLDTILLISMGIVANKLMRTQTKQETRRFPEPIDAMSCPEQIGAVQPLGQTQMNATETGAPETTGKPEATGTSETPNMPDNHSQPVSISQNELKRLHEQLIQAQKANGEKPLDFNSLQDVVTRTTKQIFAQHACQGIAFEVIRHEGKVTLQPRILREPQSPQAPENRA
ncbi:MAG: MXAN_5187 C-terminal domain-containing protein [Myxococcota bacterium]